MYAEVDITQAEIARVVAGPGLQPRPRAGYKFELCAFCTRFHGRFRRMLAETPTFITLNTSYYYK